MARSAIAGIVYFLLVYLLGFVLGTIRVMFVAPHLGETGAVLLESPRMLAASWATCGWCMRRFDVPTGTGVGALMGAIAFALLMTAELLVSLFLFGRSLTGSIAGYQTLAGMIGLAAQIAFGLMPVGRSQLTKVAARHTIQG